jgi:hypothetical protein
MDESGTFFWSLTGDSLMALIIIEMLYAIGIAAYGIGHLIDAISNADWLRSIDLGAIIDWFHTSPAIQTAPHLGLGNEALYAQFLQNMDTQFQVGELKRIILTLPALPGEGY